jgi:hypothetical protein
MLREGQSEERIAAFLGQAESGMGMAPRPELDVLVAAKLLGSSAS